MSPLNGRCEVAISKITTPSEKTSLRGSTGFAFGLLGRHVGDRPHDSPFAGQLLRGQRGGQRGIALFQLRQPEVEHLHPPVVADHHVPGLEIAVCDAALMRRADGVGERDGIGEDPIERQSARRNERVEGPPFDELQGEERNAVRFLDRVDGDDVGMIQRSDGARLALESFTAVRVHRQPSQAAP